MSSQVADYRHRRDLVVDGLTAAGYELAKPGGAFYVFPKVPSGGTGDQFVSQAIAGELLIIPGNVFSARDTHFRISYAASEATIERGLAVLRTLINSKA
jgi:aspartate aminotransferase/aminotransferase